MGSKVPLLESINTRTRKKVNTISSQGCEEEDDDESCGTLFFGKSRETFSMIQFSWRLDRRSIKIFVEMHSTQVHKSHLASINILWY